MLLKNNSRRLISITEPQNVARDEQGKVSTVTGGEVYNLLPAGDAISVPDSLCESRFVKALVQLREVLIVEGEDAVSSDGDDSESSDEYELDNKTKAELIEFAVENSIEIDESAKKADIFAAISEAVGD